MMESEQIELAVFSMKNADCTDDSDDESSETKSDEEESVPTTSTSPSNVALPTETFMRLRGHALRELVTSEESYVEDLGLIVNGYLVEIRNPNSDIPMPDDLKGDKMKLVFKNIENIYEWHKEVFVKVLQKCLEDPRELETILKRCERKLHMYVVYCQNKPFSEHIVTEHAFYFEEIGRKLNHRLRLDDLLIKPVQRIMKYEPLIKDILKHTRKAGLMDEVQSLEGALSIIKVVPKTINDLMIIKRLKNCENRISNQDKLVLHGTLSVVEINADGNKSNSNQKPRKLEAFMFEQLIIFANIDGKKTQFTDPNYEYRAHIYVNKMAIWEKDVFGPRTFMLRSTDPQRPNCSFMCMTSTDEKHKEWIAVIKNQLARLQDFGSMLADPKSFLDGDAARKSI